MFTKEKDRDQETALEPRTTSPMAGPWNEMERWFDVFGFRFGAPELRQVAVLFRNVTERRLADAALKESERKLRAVFDSTFEFIGLLKTDGTVLEADRNTPIPGAWPLIAWDEPDVKTAAGIFPATNLLDLLIGHEGILGVVTRARLRLVPLPQSIAKILRYRLWRYPWPSP